VEAWDAAVQFLLVDNRARSLAEAHPLTEDGQCERCSQPGCTAAQLASEALAVLAERRPMPQVQLVWSSARPSA
jgi:hypothetical protein